MNHTQLIIHRLDSCTCAEDSQYGIEEMLVLQRILFKVLGGVVDLPVGSVPLCSRGTGGRGGAGLDGLERLVVDS